MPSTKIDQNLEQTDYTLIWLTATFRRPALETRFRQQTLARTQKQVRISLFFGAFFGLVFWLTDIAALGYNSTTQMLLMSRMAVALTVAACFYMLAKYPQSVSLPRLAATATEIISMCSFMVVIVNRPKEMNLHGMSMSIILLVFYLFIPSTFLSACAVAMTTTVAFIGVAFQMGGLSNSELTTLILALVFTNAFGILALYRQECLTRQEFQAQDIERRALATQRQFVAMLSHEFRTPLAIIDATVQRLGFALQLAQPEFTPRVKKVRRAVARILNLLDNCLTDDRLTATDLVLRSESVDLREHLLHSYGEPSAPSYQRLRLVLPEEPQWVQCDRSLVDIALSNLVNNALKYSPENTQVTICLEPHMRPGKIAIRVEDQGPGVPTADRERVFHKFYRCEGTQRVPGSGLGLYLARELARRQGGNVTLAPQTTHQGAIFTLTLPQT